LRNAKETAKPKESEASGYKVKYEDYKRKYDDYKGTAQATNAGLIKHWTGALAKANRDSQSKLATAESATQKAKDECASAKTAETLQWEEKLRNAKEKMDEASVNLATQLNVNSNDILKLARQAATTIADQAVMIAKTKKDAAEQIAAENAKATKLRNDKVTELDNKLKQANSEVKRLNKESLGLQRDLKGATASVKTKEGVTEGLRGSLTEVNAELAKLQVAAAAAGEAADDFKRTSKKEAAQQNLALQKARKTSAEALKEANQRLKEEKDARQEEKDGLNAQLRDLEKRADQAERSVRVAAEKAKDDTNARIKAEMNLQSTIDKMNDDITGMQLTSSSLVQDKNVAIQSLESSQAQEQISSKTLSEVQAQLAAVTSEKTQLEERVQDEQGKMPAGKAVLITALSVVGIGLIGGSVSFCVQKRVPARLWQRS